MLRILAALLLVCRVAGSLGASPAPAGPLTAEETFRARPLGQAALSPDGRHLGVILTDQNDVKSLLIVDTGGGRPTGLRGGGDLDVSTFRWLDDRSVVFNVTREKIYSYGMYAAKIGAMDRFAPMDRLDATQIVGVPRARPGSVLAWIVQSSQDGGRTGPLVELDANRRASVFQDPGAGPAIKRSFAPPGPDPVVGWMADRQGELGLCSSWSHGNVRHYWYHAATGTWTEAGLDPAVRPLAFDYEAGFLWVDTYLEGRGFELRRYNLATRELGPSILTDPAYDIGSGSLHFSERERRLAGVTYDRRKPVTVWFSSAFAAAQEAVARRHPAEDTILVDQDRSDRRFIFETGGPQQPPAYELLDADSKELKSLVPPAPWLSGRPLCPVLPISFTTRDGFRLEGYLATPPAASHQHPVPLVVLAHGGPWVRDTDRFNPIVQFLASRGYAVLQPNYRGSSGYSPELSHDHEWDFRMMSEDVTDATRAVLGTGEIDPRRVAIMGSSFGGYLAISGVASQGDLYCCAVTECGVFDWSSLIKSKRDLGRPGEYERLVDNLGRPGRDRDYLASISPLARASRIHVPVLIAHGTEDQVVDVAQSKQLARELRRRGVPCETFFRAVEGHGFFNYANRVEFYHRVEAFLAANLGGVSLAPAR